MKEKLLGHKSYGSIPHLPESRMGPADHACHEGQARIATIKARDRHDEIIVTEKLDGSNVSVALIDGVIYPLGRRGYLASSSPFEQHVHFSNWAYENQERFLAVLEEGERLVGEWLMQAHGTRYKLHHEPFVVFDLMKGHDRITYDRLWERTYPGDFRMPELLWKGHPVDVAEIMDLLNEDRTDRYGFHGALEPVEGAVWRVERNKIIDRKTGKRKLVVDFLVKYVRPDKVDGKYLPETSGNDPVWNWRPEKG